MSSQSNRDRDILTLIPESVCVLDPELTITYWNPAAERLYGWSRDEAVGQKLVELLKCAYDERMSEGLEQLLATGSLQRRVYRHAKDGSLLIVDGNWAVRRNSQGAPIEIIEATHVADVSEAPDQSSGALMKAYQALAESEKKYRDLFNFMPVAIWRLDSRKMRDMFNGLREAGVQDLEAYVSEHPEFLEEAEGTPSITEANEQTLALFGATDREELLEAMPRLWLSRQKDWVAAARTRETGSTFFVTESTIQRMDGATAEVLTHVAFANAEDPESLNTVGAIDISELKRAKQSLEQSERKYRSLVQHMPIALVQIQVRELLTDFQRLKSEGVEDLATYIDANPAFLQHAMQVIRVEQGNELCCEMFGAKDSDELSGPVDRFFKIMPETLKWSLAARYSGKERYIGETRLSTLDGRVLDLLYTSAFSAELSELGVGLVGMLDIGDRLNAERRLQQIRTDFAHAARVAMLGELTASIAHEVNQPLTAISVNGQAALRWLDREPPDVHEVRGLAGRVVADAKRAGDVIARIRSMAAHKEPSLDAVDLDEIVRETVEFLHRELELHQIKLKLSLEKNLPRVLGDRTQLQQVVLNLAINANHAMQSEPPENRRLIIRAFGDADRVRIEIEDTGPGIPEHDRARLFDAFFTTKVDGLGLGLSICRSILDYHGGEMNCEHLPTGTRFGFTLPTAEQGLRRQQIGEAALQ